MTQMNVTAELQNSSNLYAGKSLSAEIIGRQQGSDLRYIASLVLRWSWLVALFAAAAAWLASANGAAQTTSWKAAGISALSVLAVVFFLDIVLATIKRWD